ncbi:MAG: hypothetical protein ACM3ZQ_05640 [Bacillota bacterium]
MPAWLQPILTTNLSNWIAALLTLAIFSILYKENPIYRTAEHIFIGVTAATSIVTTLYVTIWPGIETNMLKKGMWWEIIPIAIGLMVYCGMFKPIAWLNRIPISLWMGYGAGITLSIRTVVPWVQQITQTFRPVLVFTKNGSFDGLSSFNNIVFVATILSTLIYFFFTREHKGLLKHSASFGRWMIMIAFGASFGNTVMARISLLLGRCQFLLGEWLHIIKI